MSCAIDKSGLMNLDIVSFTEGSDGVIHCLLIWCTICLVSSCPFSFIVIDDCSVWFGCCHLLDNVTSTFNYFDSNKHCIVQCTAENWTQLNWTRSFSWVQFSLTLRRSSSLVFVQWQTLHCLADSRDRAPFVKNPWRPPILSPNCRRSLQLVAGSVHSEKLNWTVQLSSVQFSTVHRAYVSIAHILKQDVY